MSQGFIGEQLGSFRLEEVIGSGAMGVVFKATQEILGPGTEGDDGRKVVATRRAAVKIVQGEIAENTKLLQRFNREAEIIKQFRHPNIVRWLATGKFRGTYYFAMEYVEGVTLEKLLQDRGAIPCARSSTWRSRFATPSTTPTSKGSCIATSSRRT